MNEIRIAANELLFDYLYWFLQSLKANGFTWTRFDLKLSSDAIAVIECKNKRILIDWGDSVYFIPEEVSDCDALLKANLSSEIMSGLDLPADQHSPELAKIGRELFEKYQDRIHPFVLGRRDTGGILTPDTTTKKIAPIISQSFKPTEMTEYHLRREQFYQFAHSVLQDSFQLAYPGYSAERFYSLLARYDNYLKFLSRGYFVLNLIGWTGSQPFRCIDACLAGSCVVSDQIIADAYKDFPAIILPGGVGNGEFEWDSVRETLLYVAHDPQKVFEKLLPKQQEWFRKNLSMQNHCWQVLKYFYGTV